MKMEILYIYCNVLNTLCFMICHFKISKLHMGIKYTTLCLIYLSFGNLKCLFIKYKLYNFNIIL